MKVDSNPIKIIVSEEGDTAPRFVSVSPENNVVDNDGYLFIECNVTDDNGLKEVSLYSDRSGGWTLEETKQISGLDASAKFLIKDLPEGNYEWACLAEDDTGKESWSERQRVEVDVDVEIGHDIPRFMVNNVDTSRYVTISFSSYLEDSLVLRDLEIRKSDGELYHKQDMSKVSYFELNASQTLIYPYKIRVIPNEIFDNKFMVDNAAGLIFTLEYSYQGEKYTKEIKHEIKIVERVY